MYYGVFLNLNVQSISPGGKDRLPHMPLHILPNRSMVFFFKSGGMPFLKTHSVSHYPVLFCGLVFNSKKVGASIKNPLLGLKQP